MWVAALPTVALLVSVVMSYLPATDRAAASREQQATTFLQAVSTRDSSTVGDALCDRQIPANSFIARLLDGALPTGGYHYYREQAYPAVTDEIFELNHGTPTLKGIDIRLEPTAHGAWCVEAALPNPPGRYL
jgi:hypothetical protein